MNEEIIYRVLNGNRFAQWYESGRFDAHISGDVDAPSKEEILEDIRKMFQLPEKSA